MTKAIWLELNTTKAALHSYEKAPEEVKWLRSLHRHLFHVKFLIQVDRNDRQFEFFILMKELRKVVKWTFKKNQSCEQYAENIAEYFTKKYKKLVCVKVSEDGENGAIVYTEPELPFTDTYYWTLRHDSSTSRDLKKIQRRSKKMSKSNASKK